MSQPKQEIISFKVDSELAHTLARLPNRSEFIRQAVLNAVKNTCPLCAGTGHLTEHQREHWNALVEDHDLEHCDSCEAVHERVASCQCPDH